MTDDHNSTIDVKEFQSLLRDCKLLGSCVNDLSLRQIFANIQQCDDDDDNVNSNADVQMTYSEFQEVSNVTFTLISFHVY